MGSDIKRAGFFSRLFSRAAPENRQPQGVDPSVELGVSGVAGSGYGYTGAVNSDYMRELSGISAAKIYRQMSETDSTVAAIIFVINGLVRQVSWNVLPASDDEQSQDAAQFISGALADTEITFQQFMSDVVTMFAYGYSVFEIVCRARRKSEGSKFDDGKIGWRKFAPRKQNTVDAWDIDNRGSVIGFWQSAPPRYSRVFIPIEKCLHFKTTNAYGNPEGRSILRSAYSDWYYKRKIAEIEAIGIERELAGIPVMRVPERMLMETAKPGEKQFIQECMKLVGNARARDNTGFVIPSRFEDGNDVYGFSLMTSGGARQINTNEVIKRYISTILMSVMADFIMLGHESNGSFALSSDKTRMFSVALGGWLDAIAEEFTMRAIGGLCELNGIDAQYAPSLIHGDIEQLSFSDVANAIAALSGAGAEIFPNDELLSHISKKYGLPLAESVTVE